MRPLAAALAFGLLMLALPHCSAQEQQATSGRIDVYVVDSALNLGGVRGPGRASVGYCGFLGAGKERTGVTCEKRLGKDWEQIWVEFVPEGDGFVDIDLQGEWFGQTSPQDVRLVWADDVTVEGATIANGGFEEVGPDGLPAGWRFTEPFPPERYSRDGRAARSGRSCVAVWYGGQARQKFAVRRGQTYRVSAWFRVLHPEAVQEPERVRLEFPFETYRQEFEVAFKTEGAARKASVTLAPLYNGYAWAVSSRWDDNNPADVQMRDVLTQHGHRGTFYLNSLWPDWSAVTNTTTSDFGRELLKGGHSLGGHSLTHPLLSYCSRNRIFEEVAGVRMVWEAATDSPVLSYSFSYCNFTNPQEGSVVHAAIARALERGGFYNVASEPSFEDVPTELILSPIMPSDGADIDTFVESALASDLYREEHPNLTHSMHVWYRTPEAWAKFEGQLDKYGHNPNWWHCNQNEYAAYRYQVLHTRLGAPARRGRALRVRLERPVLLDLNDATPLTLRVEGVPPEEVQQVRCATADCAPADRRAGAYLLQLFHDRDQRLPKRIGMVAPNVENRVALGPPDHDTDFPGLSALLHFHDGRLRLLLDNQSPTPLTRVRVTYRLPLAWQEGIARRRLKALAAGAQGEDDFVPSPATADYKYHSGSYFFVAQIDFVQGEEPGRLYAACEARNPEIDRSYPQAGFLRLGPLPKDRVDFEKVAADWRAGRIGAQPWVLPDDTRLEWQGDDSPFRPPFLDAELIRLSGAWMGQDARHLLQGVLRSEREQAAEFRFFTGQVLRALFNGQELAAGSRVTLRAGENRLVFLVGEAAGAFLRVVNPDTKARLTDISFEPTAPSVTDPAVYAVPALGPTTQKTLAGRWRARLTVKLPPADSIASPHPDPGLSPEAKQFVLPDADDTSWPELEVPRRWSDYGGEWPRVDGEAIFRRVVIIPPEWAGKDLTLSLGPIDDFDDTFWNGALVGRTDQSIPEFYASPRRYVVPAALVKPGRNVLAVRVFDHFGEGGFIGTAADLFVAPR
jgi:peptidoglycan/xylan/chitin deacetylase (PgdA/CDA1 family)